MFLLRLPLSLMTLTWQSAFLALGQIWANKVRAILTTIGIVIGVASVTAVIAALTGLKQNVLSEFESFGTNKIFILPYPPPEDRRPHRWVDLRFDPDLFDGMLDHCPSVKAWTRQIDAQRAIAYGTRSEPNVIVTHEADVARHAKRVVRMRDGQVMSDLSVEEDLKAHAKPTAA